MRHGRRAKLLVGIGTALGLCAAGAGCQSQNLLGGGTPTPAATLGAPVALRTAPPGPAASPSVQVARAAAPAAAGYVAWRPAVRPAGAPQGGLVPVGYQPAGPPPDGAPELTAAPEPVRGQPPEGKKDDAKKDETKKDGAELPSPRPLPAGGAVMHAAPHAPTLAAAPRELDKRALPPYVIGPPDILLVEAVTRKDTLLATDQPIRGQHLVRPDGTIGLGIYGSAFVGGMTIEEARESIAAQVRNRIPAFNVLDLSVDVIAYNSQFYYVITDGGGYGEQVYPFPITGSETVLDALGRINGLPPVADKRKVWVARRGPGDMGQVMPVDWCGIAQRGATATNYQLMPGDRVYVKADHWISADAWIGKRLTPIERVFGAVLLGSETVNSINNRTGTTSGR
jgi:polysaccharide export outer membrane protein